MIKHQSGLLGSSDQMMQLRYEIGLLSESNIPIVIEGETGVGKELVASAIHYQSMRSGDFVAVNACAIPEAMFESALFGHVRGAFTGAIARSAGFLREADNGTLFLDEIGTLGLIEQAKLLRAIETGVFRPVGSDRDMRSAFRVVVASNVCLHSAVRDGLFRADLAHRLSGYVVTVPPLRVRSGDIPELIEHFMLSAPGGEFTIPEAVMQSILRYEWPGNVRQLRHVVFSLSVMASHRRLVVSDLTRLGMQSVFTNPTVDSGNSDESLRQTVLAALQNADSDTAAAARLLGVHRGTLYRWIAALEIPLATRRASRRAGRSLVQNCRVDESVLRESHQQRSSSGLTLD